MAQDELNTPLGQPVPAKPGAGFRLSGKAIALGGLSVCAAGLAGWLAVKNDGYGGRATAIAKIEVKTAPDPAKAARTAAQGADRTATGSIAQVRSARSGGQNIESRSGVKVVRRGGGVAPDALIIKVPDAAPRVGLMPAPDQRLVRKSRFGMLPRIGKDGSTPLEVYARPLVMPGKLKNSAPRLAIVIGGMGLSEVTTRAAIQALPAAVSFAFAPYGKSLQAQVSSARLAGHEVLLQVPMEPFDLVGQGPGPRLLRASCDRKQMKERLHWHMGRFTGYIGIANFLGAKFTARAEAMAPVIEEVRSRGLMYFDDGSSKRSLAGKLAGASKTPFVRTDVILDEKRASRAIDAALQKLESIAVRNGNAVGFANALPNVVARVARYVPGLVKRGVALVPVSAITGRHRARIGKR